MPDANSISQQWFDRFEATLEADAAVAGIFSHGGTTGTAREFMVRRVLNSFLPKCVTLGTGIVIDSSGKRSAQVDVVVHDSRVPVFELESGLGLYPIEGVIATIEVKSTLTKDLLDESLDNADSILRLKSLIRSADTMVARQKWLMEKRGYSQSDALRKVGYEGLPACYLFAFRSKIRKTALANTVMRWFKKSRFPAACGQQCPHIPRVIVAGKSVALLSDGYARIVPSAEFPNERPLLSAWDSERRFGLLASHLLHTILSRFRPGNRTLGTTFELNNYIPAASYFEDELRRRKGQHVSWTH